MVCTVSRWLGYGATISPQSAGFHLFHSIHSLVFLMWNLIEDKSSKIFFLPLFFSFFIIYIPYNMEVWFFCRASLLEMGESIWATIKASPQLAWTAAFWSLQKWCFTFRLASFFFPWVVQVSSHPQLLCQSHLYYGKKGKIHNL